MYKRQALKKAGYRADATVGVGGLEQYYEAYLRGQDGTRTVSYTHLTLPTSDLV